MKVLRLSVGYQCPLNCTSCYAPHKRLDTPLDLVEKVLANAAQEGFTVVALGGGEPLYTLEHTTKIIALASRLSFLVAVTTSGYGLNADSLKSLETAGLDHLQLSLGDGRVNVTRAYDFMIHAERRCMLGINLLLSPSLVEFLPAFIKRFDTDRISQVTLLLPKGGFTPRFSKHEFMRYFLALRKLKSNNTAIRIDCATQQILHGSCASEGCSFFPDGTVSRCAFGCSPREPWMGSLERAMFGGLDRCKEGCIIADDLAAITANIQTSGGMAHQTDR
jgi:hypothetical protein